MSSIDTVYEYAGYRLAGMLSAIFSGVGLPLILALAGTAFVVHSIADRGSIRDLGTHLLALVLVAWLLGSTLQQGVSTPRFIAYLGQAADLLQKRAVRMIQDRFLTAPFEWERIAARVAHARILDPALERDLGSFLASCGRTTLARAEPKQSNLLREGALPFEGRCEERRRELWRRLQAHVQSHPDHQSTLNDARAKDPSQGSAFAERYLDEVAIRAIDEPGSPTSESSLVASSLGEYSYTDRSQFTGDLPAWARPLFGLAGLIAGDEVANVAITGLAELHQSYSSRYVAKQKLYLAITVGPHLYGLSLMILLGLFPVAGLFALLPGKWKVLVNYGKTLCSVKLWPVSWAILSTFNARRGALEAFEAPERVSGSTFFAVATMYLITPALAFLVVHLAATAAAMPFSQALPSPAGPGLGPAGPAVSGVARLAR